MDRKDRGKMNIKDEVGMMDFDDNFTIDELFAVGQQAENDPPSGAVSTADADEKRLSLLGGSASLTPSQKEAVLRSGKIIVSAAAGSGKTSTMVKRLSLLVAEGASLNETLILVYNDAAAAELKDKLRNELYLRAIESSGEVRERYRRELDGLGFCKIGTIHSFCKSLIRENFEKLDLSPTFKVLDEMEHAAYMSKAMDEVFDDFAQDETFLDLVEIFSLGRKDDNLKSTIARLFELIDIQPDKDEFLDKVKDCFSSFEHSKFFEELERMYRLKFSEDLAYLAESDKRVDDLIKFDPGFATCSQKDKEKLIECYKDFLVVSKMMADGIQKTMDRANFIDMCAFASTCSLPSPKKRPTLKIMSDEGLNITSAAMAIFKAVKGNFDELAKIYANIESYEAGHQQNAVYIDKFVQLTSCFAEKLQKLKAKDGVLSFEDLQKKTVELLDKHPEVGDGYTAVFVDEYQDVNPTQEYIISKLIKGDCFMVGDVKQSIYGFRLADPKIFLSRQKFYKDGGGLAIDFNRNFRSSKRILSFVNSVFDVVMTEDRADVDYKNTSRFEIDGDSPDGSAVVIKLFETPPEPRKFASAPLYDIEAHANEEGEESGADSEGRYIAETIKSLVGKAIVGDRYMRYGDISVLFRSRTSGARRIVKTLIANGVPVEGAGFGEKDSQPERELMNFLRVIDNPRQDIPLAGFLLSFFGGYSESELAVISAYAGDCLWDRLRLASADRGELAKKVSATLDALDSYRTKAGFKNVSELMSGIISDYLYDAYLSRKGEAEIQGLRAFVSSAGDNASSLGKFLEEYSAVDLSSSGSGSGDKVHASTFHGFKGLETPVVFVSDLASQFNRSSRGGDFITFGKGYIGLKSYNLLDRTKRDTLSRIATAGLIDENAYKEEMRLLYVALTRAKQMMYITASISASRKKEFGKVPKLPTPVCDLDYISNALYLNGVDAVIDIETASAPRAEEHVRAATLADPAILEEVKKLREFKYPYAASTKLAMKYSVSALDSIDDDSVTMYAESAAEGTAYHRAMQHIDFSKRGRAEVEEELSRMVKENLLTEDEKNSIDPAAIARCLESDIMQSAMRADMQGKCMREQPFMMYKPANELNDSFLSTDKVLVQGVIDLFIDGEERVIVDFKNSYLKDADSLKRYEKQLKLYKMAVESATSAKVDKIALYSFKTGQTIFFE